MLGVGWMSKPNGSLSSKYPSSTLFLILEGSPY